MRIFLIIPLVLVLIIGMPFANSQGVPDWVKNTAGWWSTDAISETEFVNAIEFLANNGIIKVQSQQSTGQSQGVPVWVKNTAGWWSTDAISETEFVNAIEFLANNGIIQVNKEVLDTKKICDDRNNIGYKILCQPYFDTSYEEYEIFPKNGKNIIDEYGFRCNNYFKNSQSIEECKFPIEKPDNEYRIFLVGGSTMFSSNNDNSVTTSAVLQKQLIDSKLEKDIRVVNAGVSGSWSEQEVKLITEKIINFSPDLIIVYDGINDLNREVDADTWENRWTEVCKLGKIMNFETIILLQPFNGSGFKIPSESERDFLDTLIKYEKLKIYQEYRDKISILSENCYGAYDLSYIFDKINGQLFFDSMHVGEKGDKILADRIFDITYPILSNNSKYIDVQKDLEFKKINGLIEQAKIGNYDFDEVNFTSINIENMNLDSLSFKNSIFSQSQIKNVDFSNADFTNTVFVGTTLTNVDFSNTILKNVIFFKVKIDSVNFEDAILNGASFVNVEISNSQYDTSKFEDLEIINSNILDDKSIIEKIDDESYEPIRDRTEYQLINLDYEKFVGATNAAIFDIDGDEFLHVVEFSPVTIKLAICEDSYPVNSQEYYFCLDTPDEWFIENGVIEPNAIPEIVSKRIQDRTNNSNSVVIFPTITLHAYKDSCIWDYYESANNDCLNINIDDVDFNEPVIDIWNIKNEGTSPHYFWNTNLISYQVFNILGYETISELEIEEDPNVLDNYDKVIVLHNKYVTKKIFDAIINHEKVVYMHPGALSEEVELDLENKSLKILSPVKYPQDKNFNNDFLWMYDNTHREFKNCEDIMDAKFENVANGIMTNCYSENILETQILKIVKDF